MRDSLPSTASQLDSRLFKNGSQEAKRDTVECMKTIKRKQSIQYNKNTHKNNAMIDSSRYSSESPTNCILWHTSVCMTWHSSTCLLHVCCCLLSAVFSRHQQLLVSHTNSNTRSTGVLHMRTFITEQSAGNASQLTAIDCFRRLLKQFLFSWLTRTFGFCLYDCLVKGCQKCLLLWLLLLTKSNATHTVTIPTFLELFEKL